MLPRSHPRPTVLAAVVGVAQHRCTGSGVGGPRNAENGGEQFMTTAVLICDDSAMARKQIARALPVRWDVDLGFAADGREALQAIERGGAEVLFLDLNMPVMDGYEVLAEITRRDLPTVVIVVSGDVQPAAREKVMSLGALDFIRKPVDADELQSLLRRFGLIEEVASQGAAMPADTEVDLLDATREIANVAMGQAADRLARLLNVFVLLPVPNVARLAPGELRMTLAAVEERDTISAVSQGFIGAGISGEALLLFHDSSFEDMARLLDVDTASEPGVELELLMDVANLLIGACLNGIAEQLDVKFSQGHPAVLGRHARVSEILETRAPTWSEILAVEINYAVEDHDIHCDLLLLFAEEAVPALNNKLAHLL